MFKRLSMVACLFLLGGCALPVPLQIASWAIDGMMLVATEKTIADHGVSMLVQRDCAMLRVATEGALCRDGTGATAVAVQELPPPADEREEAGIAIADAGGIVVDIPAVGADAWTPEALAAFETAAGSAGEPSDPTPRDDVAIAEARWEAIIAAPVFFDDPAEEPLVAEPKRRQMPEMAFEPSVELATEGTPVANQSDFPFVGGDSLNLGDILFDLQPYLAIDLALVGGAGGDILRGDALREQTPRLRDRGSQSDDRYTRHAAALYGRPCGRGPPARRTRSRGSGHRRPVRLSLRPPGPVRIVPPPGDYCLSGPERGAAW